MTPQSLLSFPPRFPLPHTLLGVTKLSFRLVPSSPTPPDLSFSIKRGDIVLSPFSSQVLAHTVIRTSSLECVILAPQI